MTYDFGFSTGCEDVGWNLESSGIRGGALVIGPVHIRLNAASHGQLSMKSTSARLSSFARQQSQKVVAWKHPRIVA